MENEILKRALKNLPLGELRAFDTIGSTNDEALAWADAGCPDFSLVIADEQTKGRGRFDRKWVTRPGTSLAFSLILHPTQPEIGHLPLFAPLCGVAIWQALIDRYHVNSQIKWPNDVLIERQKCAGILVEAAWAGSELKSVILGIGINIKPGSTPPSTDQLFPATYIESATGQQIDRFEFLASVLQSLIHWRKVLGSQAFIHEWQSHLAFIGEPVEIVQSSKSSIIGIIKGIDPMGRLIITQAGNIETAIEVGDVHLRLAEQTSASKES